MSEKLKISRVFLGSTLLSDTQTDGIITSQTIPTQDSTTSYTWVQLNTMGSVSIDIGRETKPVGNDQLGDTGVFIMKQPVKVTIPLSVTSFDTFANYTKIDPDYTSGTFLGLKDNKGVSIPGVSLLIYDKDLDNDNETDTPDVTADPKTFVLFNCVVDSNVTTKWDGEQDIIELTFTGLANTGSGSSRGYKGGMGTFTEES